MVREGAIMQMSTGEIVRVLQCKGDWYEWWCMGENGRIFWTNSDNLKRVK